MIILGGLLTSSFRLKVEESLSKRDFLADDFSIEPQDKYNQIWLTITYKYMTQYNFVMKITPSNVFSITFSPGSILNLESYKELDEYESLNRLSDWLNNIYKELNNTPIARKVSQHDKILKTIQEKINSIENHDILFSSGEKSDFNSRLDALEADFIQKMEDTNNKQNEFQSQIKQMQSDISTLKRQLNVFTKKNWSLSFSARLYNWYKTNPLLTRQIAGFTRELLPEETREFISNEALDQLILPPDNSEMK